HLIPSRPFVRWNRSLVGWPRTFESRALKGFFLSRSILPAIAAIAALIPFINKAFHMDDPLFLWTAQQISQHSRDPFGFSVNWYRTVLPMFSVIQNPPLSSYYMAGAASFL